MAEIKISCPNCAQHIQCDESYRGKQINCPNCQNGFLVPTANGENPPKKKSHKETVAEITESNRKHNLEASNISSDTSGSESDTYVCPHCKGKCIIASDTKSGELICPKCSNTFYLEKYYNLLRSIIKTILVWIAIIGIIATASVAIYEYNFLDEISDTVIEFAIFFPLFAPLLLKIVWMISSNLLQKTFANKIAFSTNPLPASNRITFDFPLTAKSWNQKFPSVPWSFVAGLTLMVIVLCRSHLFTGAIHTSHSMSVGSLVPAFLKQIGVNGTLYVKLRTGESVSLSMVKVAAYEDEFISNKIATLNGDITQERQSSPPMSAKQIADDTRIKTLIALNNGSLNLWAGAVATAVTDKEGKYSMTLPHTGHYSFFALTGREIPAGNERYIFFRRGNLDASFSDYTVDLNNNYEEVGKYTAGWTDDTRNSFDDQTIWQDVIGWIMTREFGLLDISK